MSPQADVIGVFAEIRQRQRPSNERSNLSLFGGTKTIKYFIFAAYTNQPQMPKIVQSSLMNLNPYKMSNQKMQ